MSRTHISRSLRTKIASHFRGHCCYCQTSQLVIGPLLEIEHIIPESHGGSSEEENLAYACPLCNARKSDRVEGFDPITEEVVRLFHPRLDVWAQHFEWSTDGTILNAKSAIGRVTIATLDINHPDLIETRRLWVSAGWHPPKD